MDLDDNKLELYRYELSSSSEVMDLIHKVKSISCDNVLIHIISLIHNTVLVHKLKSELLKLFPHAEVVLLKTKDKTKTYLKIYTTNELSLDENLNDKIIENLDEKLVNCDIQLKKSRMNLLQRYFTDNLTHLPNIYQLRKDLADNEDAGIIFIKIDNFTTINNFYGFIVGDFVIEKVAEFLVNKMKGHKVYRHAGAEFVILLENNLSFYEMKDYLTKFYEDVRNLFVKYKDIKIFIDLTLASCSNTTTNDIFSKVSMALKYANENNLPFWIYEDRMHFQNDYKKNLQISSVVRYAVENSKIVPYFQPIVNNSIMKVTKFECLARLIDENNNVISPDLFISVSKKIKVYNLVTKTIIEKSFKAFENNEYEFNINLSIEDIMNSDIFEFIVQKLKSSKISSRVTFELLESDAIEDFKKIDRFIKEVKRYGAKIAIDDFGDGYSNFSYLTKIDVDFLKIDGSLISDIDVNNNSYMVVESIVDFANKLGIKTIAEYVHSSTVLD
ncbi:MAG: EAL domain-containing protein, partial [Sulfurimonas sp.]|nr:EAL domain-containing protein [Sulfurimonas sp.]